MKTKEQIQEEVKKLREMKPRVRRFSAFGDDHHESIDDQIATLEQGLDEEDIAEFEGDRYSNALEAIEWRDSDGDAPSEGWKSLMK